MEDLIFITLSLLFFVAGAAYIAGCRRLGWGRHEHWINRRPHHLAAAARVSRLRDAAPGEVL